MDHSITPRASAATATDPRPPVPDRVQRGSANLCRCQGDGGADGLLARQLPNSATRNRYTRRADTIGDRVARRRDTYAPADDDAFAPLYIRSRGTDPYPISDGFANACALPNAEAGSDARWQ